jgi:tetraacyldisaccharide 4'-kinase
MLSASEFRDIVSDQRRGLRAALWRAVFCVAEVPYGVAVWWRNRRYDRDKAEVRQVNVPVISVGNLTVGGTGKTPMVEWLARWYRQRGVRVTLISRGYGAEAGSRNDEAMELEEKLPDVPHLQNPDRVEAALTAIEELDCELIILDDAFQHRRIYRDLDIVLLDATEPFGYGHLLPRGLLREPLSGLARAHVVALSRADVIDSQQREAIFDKVRRYAPEALCVEVAHRPRALLSSARQETNIDTLAGQRIAAFCGIGNPAGFRHSLQQCGYTITEFREFPDHYAYTRDDVASLAGWADAAGDIAAVICTHKDLVKIGVERLGRHPLWALSVGMEILRGQADFESLLQAAAT